MIRDETEGEVALREAQPGEVFGLTEMFAAAPFDAGLRTVSDCQFEFVSEHDYVEALSHEPELCFHLLRKLSLRCRELVANLA